MGRELIIYLTRHLAGDGFHAKHGQCLIDFIHAQSLLALLEFTHKAKAQAGTESEFFLCQLGFPAVFLDKYCNFILLFHVTIIHPYGYKCKKLMRNTPFRVQYFYYIYEYTLTGVV